MLTLEYGSEEGPGLLMELRPMENRMILELKTNNLGVVSEHPLISQLWKKDCHFQHSQMLKPPTHSSPKVQAYRQGATLLFHAREFRDRVCPRSSEEGGQGLGGKDESAETDGN